MFFSALCGTATVPCHVSHTSITQRRDVMQKVTLLTLSSSKVTTVT